MIAAAPVLIMGTAPFFEGSLLRNGYYQGCQLFKISGDANFNQKN